MESEYLVIVTYGGESFVNKFSTLRGAKLAYESKIKSGFAEVYVTKVIAEYHG